MIVRITAAALLLAALPAVAADRKTERVIIVTVDGLRQEELFGGLDPGLLAEPKETGIDNLDALKEKYWRETPEERREAIFPFIWQTLVHEGVLLGDPAASASATASSFRIPVTPKSWPAAITPTSKATT